MATKPTGHTEGVGFRKVTGWSAGPVQEGRLRAQRDDRGALVQLTQHTPEKEVLASTSVSGNLAQ
jgi:hypothetical protein